MYTLQLNSIRVCVLLLGLALAIAGCGSNELPVAPILGDSESFSDSTGERLEPRTEPQYNFSATALSILLYDGNWATSSQGYRFFRNSPNGSRLGRSGFPTAAFRTAGMPVDGVKVDESGAGARYQCVALVKALTYAPATSIWRAGGKVVDGNGNAGTAIALFDQDGRYRGRHTAILWKRNADGSIVVIEENFPPLYCVQMRTVRRTNSAATNDYYDAADYRVVR